MLLRLPVRNNVQHGESRKKLIQKKREILMVLHDPFSDLEDVDVTASLLPEVFPVIRL